MVAYAPFIGLPKGSPIPQELPATASIQNGYVGIVQGGRVYFAAVSPETGDIGMCDRLEEAYRFERPASVAATFAWFFHFRGLSSRFVSEDGSVPDEVKHLITKGPARKPQRILITDDLVGRLLRKAGVEHDADAIAAALLSIEGDRATIEAEANSYGSRASGREVLEETVREHLTNAGHLPQTSAAP